MPVTKLAHYSIRTTDLEKSSRFHERILGFKQGYRPPFDFPGVWLYKGDDERDFGTVHIIGIDPNNPDGLVEYLGDKAHCGMGVTKAAGDAMALVAALTNDSDARRALARYSQIRTQVGAAIAQHGRHLGAYMQARLKTDTDRVMAERYRTPEAVMRETAVPPAL